MPISLSLLPLLEHRGEVQPFDEYKCAEKIDRRRLQQLRAELRGSASARQRCMDALRARLRAASASQAANVAPARELLRQLERCQTLEDTVEALASLLAPLAAADDAHVVHEVTHEHRDSSARGRLFAIGQQVQSVQSKYPRTTTLQVMPSDLRAPLVGGFAHDIDCENSEVRLLCSLASQLGCNSLVPTLIDYRDHRRERLKDISQLPRVSEADAKRLATIVINGGHYATWLRHVGRPKPAMRGSARAAAVERFVHGLAMEARALREQILQHPRFKWTAVERTQLSAAGKSGAAAEAALLPRVVQSCENEVLGIMHRSFVDLNWHVRAKIFDGLIVERGEQAVTDLTTAMAEMQEACFARGWDVHLVEKPLHGLQDAPVKSVKSVADARTAFRESCA